MKVITKEFLDNVIAGSVICDSETVKLMAKLMLIGNLQELQPCPGEHSAHPFGQHTYGCRVYRCYEGHQHIAEYQPPASTGAHSHLAWPTPGSHSHSISMPTGAYSHGAFPFSSE